MKFVLLVFFSVVALATLVQSQHEWLPWSASQGSPQYGVAGGRDSSNRLFYIIRAPKGVDPWIPGKFSPEFGKAWIPFNGKELQVTDFEVRCCDSDQRLSYFNFCQLFRAFADVKWIPASNGTTPANAVVGGIVESGEKLYIGRVAYNGDVNLGKIQPSQGGLFIPYLGLETKFTNYEQLVYVNEVQDCKRNTLAEVE